MKSLLSFLLFISLLLHNGNFALALEVTKSPSNPTNVGVGAPVNWNNPDQADACSPTDNTLTRAEATGSNSANQLTNSLQSTFDFSADIPSGATITGIQVSIQATMGQSQDGYGDFTHITLFRNNQESSNKEGGSINWCGGTPTGALLNGWDATSFYPYGGDGDLWGYSSIPVSDLANIQLRIRAGICQRSSGGAEVRVRCIQMTVYYNPPMVTTVEQTTALPTTAVQTTAIQTTAIQTTRQQTTAIQTTRQQTTRQQTTAIQTTRQQTTRQQTTAIHTTREVTTGELTTGEFTTSEQTTQQVTTAQQTTALRTTAIRTTGEQTTGEQTTNSPASFTDAPSSGGSNAVGVAFGILIPLLLIIAIIVVLVVFRKKIAERLKRNKDNGQALQEIRSDVVQPQPPAPAPVVAAVVAPQPPKKGNDPHYQSFSPARALLDESSSVHISQLRAHIESLMAPANATEGLTRYYHEYNYIEQISSQFHYEFKAASLPENLPKNRYENVLSPDHSRVLLKGGPGANYINANYLPGQIPNSDRAYIASQGPLPETIADFWRMIWELNITSVVMLTREVENNVLKCSRYWPEKGEFVNLNNLRLTARKDAVSENNEIVTRELELSDRTKTRIVTLIQYVAWPDHGLPHSTASFMELAQIADRANLTGAPIVVHCSAGLGRTGTFCVIHSTLAKVQRDLNSGDPDPTVNLISTVLNFRQQRPGMIQTEDQYMFCWMAIADSIEAIKSKKKAAEASSHYQKLSLVFAQKQLGD